MALCATSAWGQDALTAFNAADGNGDAQLSRDEFLTLPARFQMPEADKVGNDWVTIQEYLDAVVARDGYALLAPTNEQPATEALLEYRQYFPTWPFVPLDWRDRYDIHTAERANALAPMAQIARAGGTTFRVFTEARYAIEARVEQDGSATFTVSEPQYEIGAKRFSTRLSDLDWHRLQNDLLRIRQSGIDDWSNEGKMHHGMCLDSFSLRPVLVMEGNILPPVFGVVEHCQTWEHRFYSRLAAEAVRAIPGCLEYTVASGGQAEPWSCLRFSGDHSSALEVFRLKRDFFWRDHRDFGQLLRSIEMRAPDVGLPAWVAALEVNPSSGRALGLDSYLVLESIAGGAGEVTVKEWILRRSDPTADRYDAQPDLKAASTQIWRQTPEGWRIVEWEVGEFEPHIAHPLLDQFVVERRVCGGEDEPGWTVELCAPWKSWEEAPLIDSLPPPAP